jgi:hypothetical protein
LRTDLTLSLNELLPSLDYSEVIVLTENQCLVAKLIKLESGSRVDRGMEIAEILEWLADHRPFVEIEDPGAWQREFRQDHPLLPQRINSDFSRIAELALIRLSDYYSHLISKLHWLR